jgi:hypothetical protein
MNNNSTQKGDGIIDTCNSVNHKEDVFSTNTAAGRIFHFTGILLLIYRILFSPTRKQYSFTSNYSSFLITERVIVTGWGFAAYDPKLIINKKYQVKNWK